jgi:GT2 family glycosyltransferase/ADP-heptose:LPS heptosyltransferase
VRKEPEKMHFRPDGVTRVYPTEIAIPPPAAQLPKRRPGTYRKLSVVLALHGQLPLTQDCIRSLRADVPDAEIICVDNGSPDGTEDWLSRQDDVLDYYFFENRGVAVAWNAGLEHATGDVLCVLNNDTIVHPGGMRRVAQAAHEYGIAAISGGKLDTEVRFVGSTEDRSEADYPEGACLAFRRDVWEAVGPFDQRMELAYCEDTEWGLFARCKGFGFVIVPDAITHIGGATARTVTGISEARSRNEERLQRRYEGLGLGERILVHRTGALGDVIMATPPLAALRKQYPLARIYLQCAPFLSVFFQGLPDVDAVVSDVPPGITRRIELDGVYERKHINGDWQHATLAYAEAAGVTLQDLRYRLPEVSELDAWAEEILPGSGYVACGLRSVYRSKVNWHEQGWLALVRSLSHLRFVLLDPEPRPSLQAKGAYTGWRVYDEPNVVDLTGKAPSLRHLLALMKRCEACVSVDTGIMHLAGGLGLPTLALFASGLPAATGLPGGRFVALSGEAPCYPCTNASLCSRKGGPHCLSHVSGKAAAGELCRLLES